MKSKKMLLHAVAYSLLFAAVSVQASQEPSGMDYLEELRKRLDAEDMGRPVARQAIKSSPGKREILNKHLFSNEEADRLNELRIAEDAKERKYNLDLMKQEALYAKRKAEEDAQDKKDQEALDQMYLDASAKTRKELGLPADSNSYPEIKPMSYSDFDKIMKNIK